VVLGLLLLLLLCWVGVEALVRLLLLLLVGLKLGVLLLLGRLVQGLKVSLLLPTRQPHGLSCPHLDRVPRKTLPSGTTTGGTHLLPAIHHIVIVLPVQSVLGPHATLLLVSPLPTTTTTSSATTSTATLPLELIQVSQCLTVPIHATMAVIISSKHIVVRGASGYQGGCATVVLCAAPRHFVSHLQCATLPRSQRCL